MADVIWIKLVVNIFENRKIRQIESMPHGDTILIIWIKLLVLAGSINDGGLIYFTKGMPYTSELLATQFKKSRRMVDLALKIFVQYEMIVIENDIICIKNWEKYQNVDKMTAIRDYNRMAQRRSRENRKKRLAEEHDVNDMSLTNQSCQGTDKDKDDIDKDLEENNNDDDEINLENPNDQQIPQILEAARSVGLQVTDAGLMRGNELAEKYGLDKLIDAITRAVDVPRWDYVEGILRNGGKQHDSRRNDCRSNGKGDEGTDTDYSFLPDDDV